MCFGLVYYRVESSRIKCYWQIKREGRKDNVRSPLDLSLPDVIVRVTPRFDSLLLLLSIPLLHIHSLSFFSRYLCFRSKKKEASPPPIVWALGAMGPLPPSLSLSPLFLPLFFSPPLVVTEHTCLILATRTLSPITSQPLQSHPLTGFLGVELTSPLFALILLRTGRRTLICECLCIMKNLSFCRLTLVLYWWHPNAFFLSCICLLYSVCLLGAQVIYYLSSFMYSGHVGKSCSHSSAMRDPNVQVNLRTAQWRGREGGVVVQLMLMPRRAANQMYSWGSFLETFCFQGSVCVQGPDRWFFLLFFGRGNAFLKLVWCFGKPICEVSIKSEQAGGGKNIPIFLLFIQVSQQTTRFTFICSNFPFI